MHILTGGLSACGGFHLRLFKFDPFGVQNKPKQPIKLNFHASRRDARTVAHHHRDLRPNGLTA